MHELAITGGVVHDGLGSPGVRALGAIEVGLMGAGVGTVLRAGAR